jgi:hypothetical protein
VRAYITGNYACGLCGHGLLSGQDEHGRLYLACAGHAPGGCEQAGMQYEYPSIVLEPLEKLTEVTEPAQEQVPDAIAAHRARVLSRG